MLLLVVSGIGIYIRNIAWATEKSLWEDAAKKAPRSSRPIYRLAAHFAKSGQLDLSAALLQKGFTLRHHLPDQGRVLYYNNMGNILAGQGRTREAILAYREALRLRPYMHQSLYALTLITAAHSNKAFRNGEEAVKLAERLCRITNYNQPLHLDALAAAYAEAGRFDQAVKTGRRVLDMVLKSGSQDLAMNISKRLKLYQAGKPYRM